MSRRTKLIILALFLALLAIPATYVYLSWSPRDPIQFRFLSQSVNMDSGIPERHLVLEAVNVTPWPIHLDDAVLTADILPLTFTSWSAQPGNAAGSYTGTRVGEVPLLGEIKIERPPADPRDHLANLGPLRPGESRRCTVLVFSDETFQRIPAPRLRVYYAWVSGTIRQCELTRSRLCWMMPTRFTPQDWMLPWISQEGDMAPLIIPGHPVPVPTLTPSSTQP